ncbi:MAG: lipoyl(octanoyl) transferase LipB [Bacteroidetes bacterium]|nr:MAG: lipoyl(octanoyl) transferase LipB [Bacteroidota bacterium]
MINLVDLGVTKYKNSWDVQQKIFHLRAEQKCPDILLLNEHHPVYTLGKGSNVNHLLATKDELNSNGIDVYETDRGGDVTYHGPGQLVGYPILDLNNYYNDIHRYLRDLEEVIIHTLSEYGINAKRDEQFTGVWVGNDKIAAIGVKVSRWITMHGFALNVNTDLSYFDRIIPCGIFHKGVTSMERVLNRSIDMNEVKGTLVKKFAEVFQVQIGEVNRDYFLESIQQLSSESTECALQENQ